MCHKGTKSKRRTAACRSPEPAPALRAPRAGPGAGTYPDLDAQPRVLHQPHRLIDERRVLLDPIQDTLELHSVPLPRRLDVVQHPLSWIPERDALPMSRPRCVIRDGSSWVCNRLRRSKPRPSSSGAVSDGPPRQRSGAPPSHLQPVDQGPAFRLARKGLPHGRSRQSSEGPQRNRDRGEPRGSAPPTPPCVRVRTRRFDGVKRHGLRRRMRGRFGRRRRWTARC